MEIFENNVISGVGTGSFRTAIDTGKAPHNVFIALAVDLGVVGLTLFVVVLLIVFLAIPAPIFIVLYFVTKWKQSREITGGDEQMLEEIWGMSHRLEERLEALETILDNEVPEWRRKL